MAQKEAEGTARGSRQLALPKLQQREILAGLAYLTLARANYFEHDNDRLEAYLNDIYEYMHLQGVLTKDEYEQLKAGF